MDSLRIRRLNEAADPLSGSEERISVIAGRCSFGELSYFYRAFREKFNRNPGEFRKKFQSK